jgi:hypothetical protein
MAAAPQKPTYYKDVLPIVQENCQTCHRPNGANLGGMVAPMAFGKYQETRPWAKAMAKAVETGAMPPWHAAPQHAGVFKNERNLTQDEIDTIVNWAQSGATRGNPTEAPAEKVWNSVDGWTIGEPDLVIKTDEAFFVDDDVTDLYVTLRTKIGLDQVPEDKFIKAVEFRPGSSVVHHIIAMPLGGIAPGNEATVYADGIAGVLQKETTVNWQMHYHKEPGPGTGVWDQSMAAIKFYDNPDEVKYRMQGNHLGRMDFNIPPGDANYTIQQDYTFKHDSEIVSLMPHFHLRGKSAKYEVTYPDGTSEVLLDIPQYDFNWQTAYKYADFKKMPKGTKITFTSVWDNSEGNQYNPDPTKSVRFGQPTTDEMSFGYMSFINDSGEYEPMFGRGRGEGRRGGRDLTQMISQFDANKDGLLQKDEAPEQMSRFFDRLDADGDGAVSKAEAEEASKRFGQGRRSGNRPSQD